MWYLISIQSPKAPKPEMYVTDKASAISALCERSHPEGTIVSITSVTRLDDELEELN